MLHNVEYNFEYFVFTLFVFIFVLKTTN
jgi:hypothetical protein